VKLSPNPHITSNPSGALYIDGYSAAQIVEHYPDLTPAQVHVVLTYYYDHQGEMDATLMADYAQAEHWRRLHASHHKLVAARARQAS
jgi:Protein of unknown function (DUF433)